jgi:YD repeat-containing protein
LTDPSAGTITYTYDGFRQLTSQENARSQTIQLSYYSDGRLDHKIQSVEGTTEYYYNVNAQITSILDLATNIKKRFVYDRFGRDSIMVDSIPGTTKFITKYSFDSYGRLNTVTHPSGIVETKYFNTTSYNSFVGEWGINLRKEGGGGIFGVDD